MQTTSDTLECTQWRPLHRGGVSRTQPAAPTQRGSRHLRQLSHQFRPRRFLRSAAHAHYDIEALHAQGQITAQGLAQPPFPPVPLDGSAERTQALVTYLESLKRTRELPAEIVLAGHGEPITDHVALIDKRFAMHQRRAEKLYGLIAEQPRTGHELAQEIWGDVAVTQAFLTLSEVIGHVDLLVNAGHVRELEDGEVLRYEATSDLPMDRLGDLIPGGNPVGTRG